MSVLVVGRGSIRGVRGIGGCILRWRRVVDDDDEWSEIGIGLGSQL